MKRGEFRVLGPAMSPVKRGRKPGANPSPKALAHRTRTEQRLAAELCANCGKEPLDGRFFGKRCLRRRRKKTRERKRALAAAGTCVACERAPANGSNLCDGCYPRWRDQKYTWLAARGTPVENPGTGANGWRVRADEGARAGLQRG